VVTVAQNIYEAAFGNDINFHPIGNSTIVMAGVYSHTDNSPHGSPNLVDPGLSDPGLNLAKVIYRGGANAVNGNDGSYRGVNIEAEGTVQWATARTTASSCRRRRHRPKSTRPRARRTRTSTCTAAARWPSTTTARSP
jgi:hypothetical protein